MAIFTLYLTEQPWNGCVSVCFCRGLFWKGLVAGVLISLRVSHTTRNSSQIRQVTATTQNDSDLKFTSAPAIQICVLKSLNLRPWNLDGCRTPGIFNKPKEVGYPVATWIVLWAGCRVPLVMWFFFLLHNSGCGQYSHRILS